MTNIECELCEIDGLVELSDGAIPELDVNHEVALGV